MEFGLGHSVPWGVGWLGQSHHLQARCRTKEWGWRHPVSIEAPFGAR